MQKRRLNINADNRIVNNNNKVAGSSPDEVKFYIYLILPAALGPGVYSASNRNEYRKH
jgi:hypothetical protein